MELKDYYAIMGVKPTDDLKTIKTAYRRLARKYHPDVSKEPDAEARFKEVAEAWEVLSDEQRRAEYDQMWQHRNDPQFNRQFHHATVRVLTPKILTISSRQFSVSMPARAVNAPPHAATILKSKWRFSSKKRLLSISVPSAITCRFITPLA